jgi:hypothetical protein
MTAAGLAFSTFKKVIGTAKDVESISKTLGDWYGACADVNAAERQRKQPTFLEKMSAGTDNIDADSIKILMHKKTLLDREKQIRFMLDMRWGHGTYDELSDMRKKMREERRQQEHARIETKRQIANNAAIGGLSLGIISVLGGGVYLLMLAL